MSAIVAVAVIVALVLVLLALLHRDQKKKAVRVALRCPHCDRANVELAVKLGYIRGFLVYARYGSRIEIGCRACVRRRIADSAVRTLLFGWWCFPWGIATPLVVLQNLAQLAVPPPGTLAESLPRFGVALDDVAVDDAGMTAAQRRFVRSVCACASRLLILGHTEAVQRATAGAVAALTEGSIDEKRVRQLIAEGRGAPLVAAIDDQERRVALLQLTVSIAATMGEPVGALLATLEQITAELGLPISLVHQLLGLSEPDEPLAQDEIDGAAAVLGVDKHAPFDEIRARYRSLLIKWHPDHAAANGIDIAEATRRTQEITRAYETLLAAARLNV